MDDKALVQDELRKMIPVSAPTHRRVLAYAGWLAGQRGQRTSMETALIALLDAAGVAPEAYDAMPSTAEAPQP